MNEPTNSNGEKYSMPSRKNSDSCLRTIVTCTQYLSLTTALSMVPLLGAQTVSPAPLPAQLKTAQTILVANAGGFNNDYSSQAYSSFYRSLEAWNHYHLTTTPNEAELALELFVDSLSDTMKGDSWDQYFLRLNIRDVKTHIVLWSLSEPVDRAMLEKSFFKNIDKSAAALTKDLQSLVAETSIPASTVISPQPKTPTVPATTNQKKTRFSQKVE
ncbi:hypothetical protein [Granulicella sp. dw_53]|uniref:hypothetical protein n=1 Tax=Granulicella sp. dw_53 TaxID=2719792 RepID=UPI001BD233C7|nr:hypothetical protein [Granulicella sp. dw_53]